MIIVKIESVIAKLQKIIVTLFNLLVNHLKTPLGEYDNSRNLANNSQATKDNSQI